MAASYGFHGCAAKALQIYTKTVIIVSATYEKLINSLFFRHHCCVMADTFLLNMRLILRGWHCHIALWRRLLAMKRGIPCPFRMVGMPSSLCVVG